MLKTKKNLKVLMVSILLVVMTLMAVLFCSGAKAEEATPLATDNSVTSIFVPVAGYFEDGDREYGGFFMNLSANKINSTQYEVKMEVSLLTTDYKTDKYCIEQFDYYFYGTDVSYSSQKELGVQLSREIEEKNKYDVTNNNYVSNQNIGLGGKKLSFKSPYNKANNYPYIKHSIIINVTGNNPKIGVSFNKIDVIGKFLAKDTKIDTNFLYLETPLTMTNGRVIPVFKYAHDYKNTTFITGGRYTTDGGTVPSYWKKETFSI